MGYNRFTMYYTVDSLGTEWVEVPRLEDSVSLSGTGDYFPIGTLGGVFIAYWSTPHLLILNHCSSSNIPLLHSHDGYFWLV